GAMRGTMSVALCLPPRVARHAPRNASHRLPLCNCGPTQPSDCRAGFAHPASTVVGPKLKNAWGAPAPLAASSRISARAAAPRARPSSNRLSRCKVVLVRGQGTRTIAVDGTLSAQMRRGPTHRWADPRSCPLLSRSVAARGAHHALHQVARIQPAGEPLARLPRRVAPLALVRRDVDRRQAVLRGEHLVVTAVVAADARH